MATIDLNLMHSFVAVHDTGSFSRAAERLGVPRSTVSRAVATLEESLGVLLFHRTTRKVSTTTAGASLYDRVAPSVNSLMASLAELPEREEEPSGTLRVTSTVDLGVTVLAEAVKRFTVRYPKTQVEVLLSNTLVDLVRDGVDLALRISLRPLRDSTLVARKVGSIAIQLYASPAYLARKGTPRTPEELQSHDWIGFRGAPQVLQAKPGSLGDLGAHARVTCDDMSFAREVVKAGAGIGMLPSFSADAEVAAGALVRVMPRWASSTGAVYLVHPGRKHLPPKVTAFSELVHELLRQRPLAPTDKAGR
ncbi:LysR family transcriptional regulator [Hyalangium versicolor]|uniref:LysR family transcriptional regulator n=1 Tax=Hyalangium versicolor TaxID=2861190 RepID=UPI001CCFAD53|nr:LysR family transcriptional regulator [Hyalangium versicolor]